MVKVITILKHRLVLLYRLLFLVLMLFCFEGFRDSFGDLNVSCWLLLCWRLELLLSIWFLILFKFFGGFFVFYFWCLVFYVWCWCYICYMLYSFHRMGLAEIKLGTPLHLHVLPLDRGVINFCRMTFSMGCSRWLMLGLVRIIFLNFYLKPDVKAQYAVFG